ncbi:hypothetical protein EXIGLDRAFT_732445 [Exidia glandulosa HHB12029]|uniref:Uncharacterized protein n=1 Tax=Exidia glandulosa HHB12029 TaxID=1314781 RepID=A0A165ZA42_EXIGL|nr:hypothetical protein EXIGLDRAFT_732445 [Exidia glandulosa HHB12029]
MHSARGSEVLRSTAVQAFFVATLGRVRATIEAATHAEPDDNALYALHGVVKGLWETLKSCRNDDISEAVYFIKKNTSVAIREHVQNLLSIEAGIRNVDSYSRTGAFRLWANRPVVFVSVPTQTGVFVVNPRASTLRTIAEVAYRSTAGGDNAASFEDFFDEHIVQPLNLKFADKHSDASDEEAFSDGQVHPECALMQYLHDTTLPSDTYIGTSQLCCVVCFQYIQQHNACCAYEFHVFGSGARAALDWPLPTLSCNSHEQFSIGFERRLQRFMKETFEYLCDRAV